MVMRKDELEGHLKDEHRLIESGVLKDDSPLDLSTGFINLCDACRRGDLKSCQEMIAAGVNINARDQFDYTPLILASLCGHYEVVQLLLEAGALCERDTFQGERCLYNALNNRIRNLLLQYDYSKSTDPLQPLASHITGLLTRTMPKTADITLLSGSESFQLHKFILAARSPYFEKKLSVAPETASWRLPPSIPAESFQIAIKYLYFAEIPSDLGIGKSNGISEDDVLVGVDKISKQLELESLWDGILAGGDRRLARQRHQDEVSKGREQLESWFRRKVLPLKIDVNSNRANDVKWSRDNAIFADVLLRADEFSGDDGPADEAPATEATLSIEGIPVGPRQPAPETVQRKSVLFPTHRAILARSDYFLTMFSSQFQEAQMTENLQIITLDCQPEVLEIILNFLYTERADIPLELAVDVLFASDMLFIEKLKAKAAVVISTLGNGTLNALVDRTHASGTDETGMMEIENINVYDVIRAGWLLKVQRLEEFAARYLAYRLENYIEEDEFEELIKESASRIQRREETDTIELLDDIRYYLSERFRLRFEDLGLGDDGEFDAELAESISTTTHQAEEAKMRMPVDADGDAPPDAVNKLTGPLPTEINYFSSGNIRTLDGHSAGDEFASDAINYQVLLGKIDALLARLKLDA